MATWNTPAITAAERDRAGLAVIELVDSLQDHPRGPLIRAEIAALLFTGVLFETGEEAEGDWAHADETIKYVLARVGQLIRELGDVMDR